MDSSTSAGALLSTISSMITAGVVSNTNNSDVTDLLDTTLKCLASALTTNMVIMLQVALPDYSLTEA